MMRKAPTLLACLFLFITLTRVANFASVTMRAGWLGGPFSAGLGAAVLVAAYFSRVSAMRGDVEDKRSVIVREYATKLAVLFVILDGLLNAGDVYATVLHSNPLEWAFAIAYAITPTLAVALFGAMQGKIDRLPHLPAKPNAVMRIVTAWLTRVESRMQEHPALVTQIQPEIVVHAPEQIKHAFWCAKCQKHVSGNAGSHARWAHKVETNGHKETEKVTA